MTLQQLQDELAAAQLFLLAVINAHPDKQALLNGFDAVITSFQAGAGYGDPVQLAPGVRGALNRYFAQLQLKIDEENPPTP